MRPARVLGLATLAGAATQWGPMLTSVAQVRRRSLPTLSGMSARPHIGLTYDDGPDPVATPLFLELLDRHQVSATFFLLGAFIEENALLVKEMAAAGHELAVHGWDHQCLAWKPPGRLVDELRRTRHIIEDLTCEPVGWFRPPYGVMTGEGLVAARRAGLQTVLWSAWGRDWSRRATPESITSKVSQVIQPGGTVLLHDTDRTAGPGSWRRTLVASEELLANWSARGIAVGALRDHWPDVPLE